MGAPPARSRECDRDDGRGQVVPELVELSPFSAFCAVYLGITETDGFQPTGLPGSASRFGLSTAQLEAYLAEQGLRRADLRRVEFDLEGAQLDIRVAPEGISRAELARTMFEELRAELALDGHACEPPRASSAGGSSGRGGVPLLGGDAVGERAVGAEGNAEEVPDGEGGGPDAEEPERVGQHQAE